MQSLYAIQRELDEKILATHGLERNRETFLQKLLAFQVELGELANETRCFKFWSLKPASSRDVILEEYVDGIHFLLSMGIDQQWEAVPETGISKDSALPQHFQDVYEASAELSRSLSDDSFMQLFKEYLLLGEKLQFSKDEIVEAYKKKNETNHRRQQEGY
ncbi:dimeric dUTPase (all-alpha-NTP-PPase superfamily) [Sinobaca qinghaiensis]|uniref:Dimeric dUTPase (All-alpha-NTP-PPase superfamily) n=1 Tax=Sinobaca qinghaiensis TaxID=342944 RepID=A0A419V6W6_9BACL|nr:dUTP diphosphatase [Sinobaca qinghaiensis]RKD75723.1 dimeric dUTPase (all-alpha-NTP-PPase superfamily) [Sinobaca qinghaiensis]